MRFLSPSMCFPVWGSWCWFAQQKHCTYVKEKDLSCGAKQRKLLIWLSAHQAPAIAATGGRTSVSTALCSENRIQKTARTAKYVGLMNMKEQNITACDVGWNCRRFRDLSKCFLVATPLKITKRRDRFRNAPKEHIASALRSSYTWSTQGLSKKSMYGYLHIFWM